MQGQNPSFSQPNSNWATLAELQRRINPNDSQNDSSMALSKGGHFCLRPEHVPLRGNKSESSLSCLKLGNKTSGDFLRIIDQTISRLGETDRAVSTFKNKPTKSNKEIRNKKKPKHALQSCRHFGVGSVDLFAKAPTKRKSESPSQFAQLKHMNTMNSALVNIKNMLNRRRSAHTPAQSLKGLPQEPESNFERVETSSSRFTAGLVHGWNSGSPEGFLQYQPHPKASRSSRILYPSGSRTLEEDVLSKTLQENSKLKLQLWKKTTECEKLVDKLNQQMLITQNLRAQMAAGLKSSGRLSGSRPSSSLCLQAQDRTKLQAKIQTKSKEKVSPINPQNTNEDTESPSQRDRPSGHKRYFLIESTKEGDKQEKHQCQDRLPRHPSLFLHSLTSKREEDPQPQTSHKLRVPNSVFGGFAKREKSSIGADKEEDRDFPQSSLIRPGAFTKKLLETYAQVESSKQSRIFGKNSQRNLLAHLSTTEAKDQRGLAGWKTSQSSAQNNNKLSAAVKLRGSSDKEGSLQSK